MLVATLMMISSSRTEASPFAELYVSGPCGVELVCSPDSAGTVLALGRHATAGIDVRRSDDALYVSVSPGVVATGRVSLKIYTAPSIRIICAEGRSSVSGSGLHSARQMSLVASGASSLNFSDLSAENVNVSLSGSGKVTLEGQISATTINLSLTGSGKIMVNGLAVTSLSQSLRGSGRMTVIGSAGKCAAVVTGTGSIDVSKLVSNDMDLKLFGNGHLYYPAGVRIKTNGNVTNIISVQPYQPL